MHSHRSIRHLGHIHRALLSAECFMNNHPSLRLLPRHASAWAGFTLFESVVVLVLLGVVAAYVAPQAFNAGPLTLRAQARALASELQRAQLLAVTSGSTSTVTTTVSGDVTQYTVTYGSSPKTATTVALEVGVAFKAGSLSSLSFDSMGQPSSAGHFELTSGTSPTVMVSIIEVTGLVTVD